MPQYTETNLETQGNKTSTKEYYKNKYTIKMSQWTVTDALAFIDAIDAVAISHAAGRLHGGGQSLQTGHGSLQPLH